MSIEKVKRVFVVAVGKCAFASANAVTEKLGSVISGGIAIDIHHGSPLGKIKFIQGDHPFPTKRNVDATMELLQFLDTAEEDDLVISLIFKDYYILQLLNFQNYFFIHK